MSRWSPSRAQTEPLAALVAVAILCLALGIYAGFLTDALPGTSDRAVEEPALDGVWSELETGGVYSADAALGVPVDDRGVPVGTAGAVIAQDGLDPAVLPDGREVFFTITVREAGAERAVAAGHLAPDGSDRLAAGESEGVPEGARTASRPVPVALEPGEVRGGTLRVAVWS